MGGGWETERGHGGSWAVRSGLESVPLGDVSARPGEHVFPVLHFCWSALPRQVDLREGKKRQDDQSDLNKIIYKPPQYRVTYGFISLLFKRAIQVNAAYSFRSDITFTFTTKRAAISGAWCSRGKGVAAGEQS